MATRLSKSLEVLKRQLTTLAEKIDKMALAAEKAEAAVKAAPKKAAAKKTAPKKKAAPKTKSAAKKATSKKTSAKKPVKKAAAKKAAPAGSSAPAIVIAAIEKAPNEGIDTAALSKATGFKGKKLANAVYRLKKQGKIVNPKRGVYKMA